MSRLLEPNLKLRLTAAEALQHRWIKENVIRTPLKKHIISSLLQHKKLSDFQHLCMLVLCEVLSLADHGFISEA